ncbi:hypothetical protein [Inquilinus limosus]|uniref:hypothetical protein n=1 Tax=Inquilinus limosus TaxID=171674 RepID=UPI0003F6B5D4|nr:hypothetical protein [Inquilinus limosus]
MAINGMTSVNTLVDLQKAAPPTDGNTTPPAIFLRGRDNPSDKGGGTFSWRADSTAMPDSGIVVRPSSITDPSAAGRWHRVFDGAVSPYWFGAKGDGATDDSDAINAAIAAAGRGNHCLDLVGRFLIKKSIQWDYPITIRADCDILCAAGSYNPIRDLTGYPSVKTVAFDLRGAKFGTVTGSVRIKKAGGETLGDLCAIGSSRNFYSTAQSESADYLVPYEGRLVSINGVGGRGGSNTCWQSLEVHGLEYGVYSPARGSNQYGPVEFDRNASYQAGALVISGGRVFRCTAATGDGKPGAPIPYVANTVDNWEYIQNHQNDDPIPQWSQAEAVKANELRRYLSGGIWRVYRAVSDIAAYGPAPTHGPSAPQDIGNTTFQYDRLAQYYPCLTGMTIAHFFALSVANAWTSRELSGDDSHVSDFRAQACRGPAITLDHGFLSAGAIFIEGSRERYANGDTDQGAFAVECGPYSKLLCQSLYLQGRWRGGVLLGQNGHVEGWCQPDQTFKTATGTFLEFADDAARATGRITMSYNALRAHTASYFLLDNIAASIQGGDIIRWKKPATGAAVHQMRVLSASRDRASYHWVVAYRLLPREGSQILSSAPETGETLEIWRSNSLVGTDKVFEAPTSSLLSRGVIGVTASTGAERNFEIVTLAEEAELTPYRNIQPTVAVASAKDQLHSRTACGGAVWRYDETGSFGKATASN